MSKPNPYVRSFIVSSVWFGLVALKMFARHSGSWSEFPPFKVVIVVVAWLITALLMGAAATRWTLFRTWWGMGLGTIAGSIAVLLLMLLSIQLRAPRPGIPEFDSTDARMEYMAGVAAEWVRMDRGVELDYTLKSIEVIEEELDRIAKDIDGANPPQGTRGLAMGYGAYVGEVFRRRDGGSWATDHPMAGAGSFPLTTKSNVTIFPVNWCWRRLTVEEEDNVYHKALLFDRGIESIGLSSEEQADTATKAEEPTDGSAPANPYRPGP